jgi:cell wall-associated NlpC family hydrolase
MNITQEAQDAFQAHALREYPKEACGVIVEGKYLPCTNAAKDPLRDFKISAKELASIKATHGTVEAILHTHPYHPNMQHEEPKEWPSGHDLQSWIKSKKPWGIAATDGQGLTPILWLDDKDPGPLVGREFVWGKNDCYSLIRDWFKQERKVTLPNFPRHWKFWERGEALYDDNFEAAGFVEISPREVVPGDCCLMRIRGTGPAQHAAVITAPDQILHHLLHRLSGYDSLFRWQRQITKYVRYVGNK